MKPTNRFSDLFESGGQEEPPIPELSASQRFIVQNFFDTQPAKRAAYLKQIGFEVDPSDKEQNRIKPIGYKGGYIEKVDPDYSDAYKKGGAWGALKELGQDIGDIGYDVGISALTKGPLLAAGPAGWIAGISTAVASGALSNAAAETLKAGIGDLVLDENIPQDLKATAIQSALAGIAPQLLSGAGKGISFAAKQAKANLVIAGIKNAAKAVGGENLTDDILKYAVERPKAFDPANTAKVAPNLLAARRKIFGLGSDDVTTVTRQGQISKDSLIGKKMAQLNTAADAEMAKLAENPKANFTVKEITDAFDDRIKEYKKGVYSGKLKEAGLKELEDARAGIIQGVRKNLRKEGNGLLTNDEVLNTSLTFDEARGINKALKDDSQRISEEGAAALMQVAGSGPGQIGALLKERAKAAGSSFSDIQDQRAALINFFNNEQKNLSTGNLAAAYLGKTTNVAKENVRQSLEKLDALTGADIASTVKDLNFQSAFQNAYENPALYKNNDPLIVRLAQGMDKVGPVDKLMGTSGAIADATVNKVNPYNVDINRGDNVAQMLSDAISKRSGLKDEFARSMSTPSVVNSAIGTAASKLGVADPEPPVGKVNEDRVNRLLEGL